MIMPSIGCHCHGTAAENCTMVLSFDEHDAPCLDLCARPMEPNRQAAAPDGCCSCWVWCSDINNAVAYADHYLLFPSGYLHYPGPPSWPCGNDGETALSSAAAVAAAASAGSICTRECWLPTGRGWVRQACGTPASRPLATARPSNTSAVTAPRGYNAGDGVASRRQSATASTLLITRRTRRSCHPAATGIQAWWARCVGISSRVTRSSCSSAQSLPLLLQRPLCRSSRPEPGPEPGPAEGCGVQVGRCCPSRPRLGRRRAKDRHVQAHAPTRRCAHTPDPHNHSVWICLSLLNSIPDLSLS